MPEKRKGKRQNRKIVVPPLGYQPSIAEQEEKFDMPGADDETIQRALFDLDVVRRDEEED